MNPVKSSRFWILLVLVLAMALATGCSRQQQPAPTDEPQPQEQPEPERPGEQQAPPEEEDPELSDPDPVEEDMKGNRTEEKVRVVIELESPSVASAGYDVSQIDSDPDARAYRDKLERQQEEILQRIEAATGAPVDVVWRFTLRSNAISAWVRPEQIPYIEMVQGVAGVSREMENELHSGLQIVTGDAPVSD